MTNETHDVSRHQTQLGGITFTFVDESNVSSFPTHSLFPEQDFHQLSGDFQFAKPKSFAYWRTIAPVMIIAVVLSIAFFSVGKSYKSTMASNLKALFTVDEKESNNSAQIKQLHAPIAKTEIKPSVQKSELQDLEKVDIAPFESPIPLEKSNSVAEIKQIEKTTITPSIEETKPKEVAPIIEKQIKKPSDLVNVSPSTPTDVVEKVEKKPLEKPTVERVETFKTQSIAKARALSAKTGRYVLIKFSADWCVTCKLMESTAMKDEKVLQLLKEKYVVLNVNVDRGEGPNIKEEFYIEKLPTLIVLDELGNQMKREEKALGTVKLIEMLESAGQYIYLKDELTVQNEEVDRVGER